MRLFLSGAPRAVLRLWAFSAPQRPVILAVDRPMHFDRQLRLFPETALGGKTARGETRGSVCALSAGQDWILGILWLIVVRTHRQCLFLDGFELEDGRFILRWIFSWPANV
jgi:hypothetical protein